MAYANEIDFLLWEKRLSEATASANRRVPSRIDGKEGSTECCAIAEEGAEVFQTIVALKCLALPRP